MEKTALHAHEHGFNYITTTNATSRWKDEVQVNSSGVRAAERYDDVHFWARDWKTDDMTQRKYTINADMKFYKQEYCGCSYSLRDVNAFRRSQGQGPIKIPSSGIYHDPVADAEEESVENVEAFFTYDTTGTRAEQRQKRQLAQTYKDRKKDATGDNSNW
jgi:hypothetical protein